MKSVKVINYLAHATSVATEMGAYSYSNFQVLGIKVMGYDQKISICLALKTSLWTRFYSNPTGTFGKNMKAIVRETK